MPLKSKLPIGLLDLLLGRCAICAQDFVVVAFLLSGFHKRAAHILAKSDFVKRQAKSRLVLTATTRVKPWAARA